MTRATTRPVPLMISRLPRTRSGPFRLEQCVTLERLEIALADGSWPDALYAPDEALLDWRAAILGTESERRVLNGMPLRLAARIEGDGPAPDEPLRAYSAGGRFLGILRWERELAAWQPRKVLLVEPVE